MKQSSVALFLCCQQLIWFDDSPLQDFDFDFELLNSGSSTTTLHLELHLESGECDDDDQVASNVKSGVLVMSKQRMSV